MTNDDGRKPEGAPWKFLKSATVSTSSTSQFPVDKCHTFIGHLRRRHP